SLPGFDSRYKLGGRYYLPLHNYVDDVHHNQAYHNRHNFNRRCHVNFDCHSHYNDD
ncbi:hypothetical protein FRC00_008357, partial [Tulasnella sp. 408]